jgi:hypothetical protein
VVALKGEHSNAGHALLYRTVQHPIVSAIFLGPVYLPQGHQPKSKENGDSLSVVLHSGHPEGTLAAFCCSQNSLVAVLPLGLSKGGREGRSLYSLTSASQTETYF